ncbi:hypothetical protein Q9295_17260, partial [Xinfangfangia sp. CPCC 101601]
MSAGDALAALRFYAWRKPIQWEADNRAQLCPCCHLLAALPSGQAQFVMVSGLAQLRPFIAPLHDFMAVGDVAPL